MLGKNAKTIHSNPITYQTRPIMHPHQGLHMETNATTPIIAMRTITPMITALKENTAAEPNHHRHPLSHPPSGHTTLRSTITATTTHVNLITMTTITIATTVVAVVIETAVTDAIMTTVVIVDSQTRSTTIATPTYTPCFRLALSFLPLI